MVDNREQEPLFLNNIWYKDKVELLFDTIDYGDYTLVCHDMPKDDHSVIVERKKSCMELCTNLGTKWDQFRVVLEGMKQYAHRCILVSDVYCFDDLYNKGYTKMHPNFIIKQLISIQLDYEVPIYFLKNKMQMENYMYKLFSEIKYKTEQEN